MTVAIELEKTRFANAVPGNYPRMRRLRFQNKVQKGCVQGCREKRFILIVKMRLLLFVILYQSN